MFYPHGEALAAAAAGAAGAGYILSTLCGSPLEEVKAAATRPVWYQLYLVGGHDVARAGIERARKAGFSALVVTIDTPVAGMRERDHRNGTSELLTREVRHDAAATSRSCSRGRAGWRGFIADGGLMSFPNVMLPTRADGVRRRRQRARAMRGRLGRSPLDPRRLEGADRRQGRAHGRRCAAGGGRGRRRRSSCRTTAAVSSTASPPTLRVLPEVVAAVGDRTEVLFDGGIRRGSDIVKALALGARAVLVGRAYVYGSAPAAAPASRARSRSCAPICCER